jgi:hypothetical protein
VRSTTLWARLLGLVHAVVEDVEFDEAEECIVVSVRPRKATKRRCGRCGKRCPGYDRGGDAAGGEHSIWAPCGRSSRPTRHGCVAPTTESSPPRCRGLATAPGTPTRSTTLRRGW